MVVRRTLAALLVQPAPEAHDIVEAADLLDQLAHEEAAARLRALEPLWQGVAEAEGRRGDLATQLHGLVRALPDAADALSDPVGRAPVPPPSVRRSEPLPDDWLVERLSHVVASLVGEHGGEHADGVLREWDAALRTGGPDADALPRGIAAAADRVVATIGTKRLLALAPLALPPFGSAALLHAAARLPRGGLAPFLAGLHLICDDPLDVLALAAVADAGAKRAPFVALLGAMLPSAARGALIERLADDGDTLALRATLLLELHALAPDSARLHQLRDAAIDLGELDLGVAVQRRIVSHRPDRKEERVALGELEATAGNRSRAGAQFCAALRLAPDDRGACERLQALRRRRFQPYLVRGGFGSAFATTVRRRRLPSVS